MQKREEILAWRLQEVVNRHVHVETHTTHTALEIGTIDYRKKYGLELIV